MDAWDKLERKLVHTTIRKANVDVKHSLKPYRLTPEYVIRSNCGGAVVGGIYQRRPHRKFRDCGQRLLIFSISLLCVLILCLTSWKVRLPPFAGQHNGPSEDFRRRPSGSRGTGTASGINQAKRTLTMKPRIKISVDMQTTSLVMKGGVPMWWPQSHAIPTLIRSLNQTKSWLWQRLA